MVAKVSLLAVSALLTFFSCSSGKGNVLVIGSASSLTDVMRVLVQDYEKRYNGNIKLYTAASGIIAAQIQEGAAVDIFIPADIKYLNILKQSGLVLKDDIICKNSLVFAAKAGEAANYTAAITDSKIKKIGIGNPEYVPAGRYAVKLLKHMKSYSIVKRKFVYGTNVSQVLRWLESGNVDAAFMYRTDALLYPAIHILKEWRSISGTSIQYPAMVLTATKLREESLRFLAFLSSPEAQLILKKYGFGI